MFSLEKIKTGVCVGCWVAGCEAREQTVRLRKWTLASACLNKEGGVDLGVDFVSKSSS